MYAEIVFLNLVNGKTTICGHRRGFSVHDTELFYQFANIEQCAKLDIHTAVTLKISVFLDVMLYSLVDVYQIFRGKCCLFHVPWW